MTLNSLIHSIGLIGINDKLVNWSGGGPSVYQAANALTIKDYPFLFCSPTGTHRVEENWTTYNVTIFYVSRLLEDNSNEMDIQSTAVEVLKNIVKKISNIDGVVAVADEYTINVFVEYEKFTDRCTGAYAQLDISILNDTTCTVDEEHYFVFDNLPGEVLPADSNKYYISWRTDYPAINYTFILPNGEIVNGYTEEHSIVVSFPENTDRAEKTLTFIAFADVEVGRLEFYQKSIDFFEFITEDNQVLRADTTGFNVAWATNIEGEITYEVTLSGETYESGTTTEDNVTIYFERNDYRDRINDFEITVSIAGAQMGTLQWKQDKPIFKILAGGNVVLPAEATAATITWETTYPWVGWGLHSYVTGEDLASGTTSGTTLYVTFPENTDTENQSFYTVGFWNPNGEPLAYPAEIRQNPAEPTEYYFNFITESGQTLSASTTALTVEWEMNYPNPAVQYQLYDGNEMIVLGNTTGTTATVAFHENLTTDRKQYVFEAWNYNGGFRYGQLVFYQEALPVPVYYFRITSEDGQTVPANATAFTINYETNIEPPLHYVYTSPFGVYEGDSWNQSSLTITFEENDKTAVQERRVEIGGNSITWYQAAAAYQFEFINTEGITVPAATTAYTVEWRTNLDSIGYKFYSGNILVTSGNTSATAMTVTFEENVSTSRTNTLRFIAYAGNTELDTLHWTQAFKVEDEYLNTGITTDLVIGTEVMEAADVIPYGYYGLEWEAGDEWFVNGRTGNTPFDSRYNVFGDMHVENGVVPLPYSQKIRIFQAIPVADIPELSGQTLYYYNASAETIWDRGVVYTGAAYCMRDLLTGNYLDFTTSGFANWTSDPVKSVFFDRMCGNLMPDKNGIKVCICPANVISDWVNPPAIGKIYGNENVLVGKIRYWDPEFPPSAFNTYAEWNEVRCGWHPLTPIE